MRLLHAGHRHVAVRPRRGGQGDRRAHRRGAGRQPLPLHRLWPDHRRRREAIMPDPEAKGVAGKLAEALRRDPGDRTWPTTTDRRVTAAGSRPSAPTNWPAVYRGQSGRGDRGRRPPTSACGSPSCSGASTRSISLIDIGRPATDSKDRDPRATIWLRIGAAVRYADAHASARRAFHPAFLASDPAPAGRAAGAQSAARSAATSPTARRSATCRRP
jgi:hypothetical protein